MSRFKFPIVLGLALAAFAWAATPDASAQRGGRGGGGRGGGYHGGGYHGGGYYGGYRGGYYGGYGHYGYGRYGYGSYPYYGGYGWRSGGYPYYGYSSYYQPGYVYDYSTPTYVYPDDSGVVTRGAGSYAPANDNSAMLHVRVPGNAQVWVEGEATRQSGPERDFVSPPLQPDKTYQYEIRARWMQDGKPVVRTKTVTVHANETKNVDFRSEARAD